MKRGEESALSPVTEMIIMLTMNVGMGEITKTNWRKFFVRCSIIQKVLGPFLHQEHSDDGPKPYWITDRDIYNHIGLRTNVSFESNAKWRNRIKERLMDNAFREALDLCTDPNWKQGKEAA